MAMTVSVVLYKRLGISNADIAFYTSWLYLPWVIKPLWSPFLELYRTKRYWILLTQLLIGATLACIALTLPAARFFQYTLAFFWLMAFSSATHDIAADGFYMLGLSEDLQAAYAGVRTTFYRIATIGTKGGLVIFAGFLEESGHDIPSMVHYPLSRLLPCGPFPLSFFLLSGWTITCNPNLRCPCSEFLHIFGAIQKKKHRYHCAFSSTGSQRPRSLRSSRLSRSFVQEDGTHHIEVGVIYAQWGVASCWRPSAGTPSQKGSVLDLDHICVSIFRSRLCLSLTRHAL
jgi:hypothetical protein